MPRPKKITKPHTPGAKLPSRNEKITFSTDVRQPKRIPTRLHSFDWATGGGLVERSIIEISGYEGVGKSTICSYLVGVNGGPEIAVLPLEAYDPDYLVAGLTQAGYEGAVWEVPPSDEKGRVRDDEELLDAFATKMADENVKAGLVDSVGAISPVAEAEGSVGEANMGRRARIMAPFLRKIEKTLNRRRQTSALVFLINHQHPNLGFAGTTTTGGKAIHFHATIRARLNNLEKFEDGSRIIEGKVFKLRWRVPGVPDGAPFKVFIKVGMGVHVGLTAVYDAIDAGVATAANGRVTLGDKNYGFLSKLIYEKFDDPDLFKPFITALEKK